METSLSDILLVALEAAKELGRLNPEDVVALQRLHKIIGDFTIDRVEEAFDHYCD
jgi:hypothetical protein